MYWYTDRNGKEVQFGYGNESWNKMEYEIEVGETENDGNNIVVSFDYNISNGDSYEWRMPRLDIMGVMIGMPSETSETSMYGCFINGAQIIRPKRASTSDGWHNAKLVIAPYAENNRVKAEAVIFDGEVFMLDDAYAYTANNAYATDDGVYLKTINVTVNCPAENIAKEGETIINIRNMKAERVEGLNAEVYAPNGTVSPTEDIKINFNYPVDEKINAEDILIYEADSDEPIENSISLEKKYDNKQLAVSVGDGGLYYGKEYAVVINKPLVVNEYLRSADNKYSFRTDEYPNNLTRAEFTRVSDRIDYVLSSENDEYYVAAASYDEYGAMTGINIVLAKQTGSDSRRRAEGSVPISEMSKSKSVKVFVLKGDKSGIVYRLPQEFTLN